MSNDTHEPSTKTPLASLAPKMRLTGTIKKVALYGAFVDVGTEHDGLIHISALSTERVNNVTDVVKEGDSVTVWVRRVDPAAGRLDLTMVEPLALEWEEIKPDMVFAGKVTKLERFGAFVDIGAERPGLVHISELAGHRVESVEEVVKPGQEVQVKVLAVDARKKQIKLSIKAAEAVELSDFIGDEESGEEDLTAMQVAFKRAAAGDQAAGGALRRGGPRYQERRAQEDILSRTLASRRK